MDLPGFGYARGGATAAEELRQVAEAYFREAAAGARASVLLLIDSRHPGLESDTQAHDWLLSLGATPVVVATKVDKLSRAQRTRHLREVERIFGKPALAISAERGEGMDELWKTIANRARAAERSLRAADE